MRARVFAICVGLAVALTGCGGDDAVRGGADSSADKTQQVDPTAGRRGPLATHGVVDCVESYAPAAVTKRALAFDGVVIDIGRSVSDRAGGGDLDLPGVTFRVTQWFGGGEGSTSTVDLQLPEDSYGIGSRLLVSGESRRGDPELTDAIAWPCGFTRYYDAETAQAWEDAY